MARVGERLKEERLLRGWSQRDLAREAGTTAETISSIETGQHEPRPSTLRKLADGLGLEVRDFYKETAVPLAEAPRGAGPPLVTREELAAQDIPATDREVEQLNYTIADLWRLVVGGEKPRAFFKHEDVDTTRVWMLMDLVLETPNIVTPEAAGVVRQGMRERLKA